MSSIEVSLMASNHKMEADTERFIPRTHRPPPPPPPPSQSQIPNLPIEQTIIPPERTIMIIYFFSLLIHVCFCS
jgi:hypothetical protein